MNPCKGRNPYRYRWDGGDLEGLFYCDDKKSFDEAREILARSLEKQGIEDFEMRLHDEDYEAWRN
jgi:hypothetical protein